MLRNINDFEYVDKDADNNYLNVNRLMKDIYLLLRLKNWLINLFLKNLLTTKLF